MKIYKIAKKKRNEYPASFHAETEEEAMGQAEKFIGVDRSELHVLKVYDDESKQYKAQQESNRRAICTSY